MQNIEPTMQAGLEFLAEGFAAMFADAPGANYIALNFTSQAGETYEITAHRPGYATPHEKRKKAEALASAALHALQNLYNHTDGLKHAADFQMARTHAGTILRFADDLAAQDHAELHNAEAPNNGQGGTNGM